ncbi:MAG TPA: BlaI/MecI/CopY family transcriptional regulator [Flavobacteriales bacterium]|nr:BlaI/MecI/CopY family transcriptional regulator [Flavobacteriales bacterium]
MESLTRAEEQVMLALWGIGKGFAKDILEALPKPKRGGAKPAITTVSTIVRILEQKGFVGHESFGRAHRYYPLVSHQEYRSRTVDRVVHDHFGGSAQGLLSHFIQREDISTSELDELLKLIKQRKQD